MFSLDPSPDATEERILELRERDTRVKLLRFLAAGVPRRQPPARTVTRVPSAAARASSVIVTASRSPRGRTEA